MTYLFKPFDSARKTSSSLPVYCFVSLLIKRGVYNSINWVCMVQVRRKPRSPDKIKIKLKHKIIVK